MSQSHVWATLRFPRETTSAQALAALLAMSGSSTPFWADSLIWEVVGATGGIIHRLRIPEARSANLHRQLHTALPGLFIETIEEVPELSCSRAWRAWQSSKNRSLNTDQAEVIAHGMLTALASVVRDETLALQWLLGPVRRPSAVANKTTGTYQGNLLAALGKAALKAPEDLDSDAVHALRVKQALPGWKAVLRIGVSAQTAARERQLLGGLASAVRVAQGPGVQLGFDGIRPSLINRRRRPLRWRVTINVAELVGLSGLPLGDVGQLPVARITSRQLPAPRSLSRHGHVIGISTYDGGKRPVAISIEDGLRHFHLIGATGSGKSTVILNCIVQDMEAGRSVLLIEPQGDLVKEVLARVPTDRLDDVVVIDPTSDRPVGLNPLSQPGVPGELIADQLLAVFKGLWADSWGPRTQDILTAGLLTLVSRPGSSLISLPLLFTDASFRRELLSQGAPDPLGIGPFWSWWDALSVSEQTAALAAPMNKLRQFLVRARLRRTVGQPSPLFDIRELFTRRRIVLFDLRKGLMGPEASNLLGSLAVSMVWQAALGRVAVTTQRRHPVFAYVDEFQDYIHLPQDFSDVLAQARKLALGITLSHQNLAQITNQTLKSAVLTNSRSRLLFSTGDEDATLFTKNDARLNPEDVVGLGSYEAYASLLSRNQSQPYASINTLPPPPAINDPDEIRERSARVWGRPAGEIDAALEALIGQTSSPIAEVSSDDGVGFGITTRRKRTEPPKGGHS